MSASDIPVPFASVTLKGSANQFEKAIQTDSVGAFAIKKVSRGRYTIATTYVRYAPYQLSFDLNKDTALMGNSFC